MKNFNKAYINHRCLVICYQNKIEVYDLSDNKITKTATIYKNLPERDIKILLSGLSLYLPCEVFSRAVSIKGYCLINKEDQAYILDMKGKKIIFKGSVSDLESILTDH